MTLAQLYPERRALTAEEASSGLRLGELAPAERPYLVLNMVATADGKVAVAGRAGPISNPTDQALLYGLRTQVDAIMVGAGTAGIERYGDLLPDAELPQRRAREGLERVPLVCLVSGSLRIPADLPLLGEDDCRLAVLTASADELPPSRARVDYLRGDAPAGQLDLAPLLGRLRSELGVRSIACEGGPTLNAALLREGLVDELFLAIAPQLAGGSDVPTAVAGNPLPEPVRLEPLRVLEEQGYLYLRYRVLREAAA